MLSALFIRCIPHINRIFRVSVGVDGGHRVAGLQSAGDLNLAGDGFSGVGSIRVRLPGQHGISAVEAVVIGAEGRTKCGGKGGVLHLGLNFGSSSCRPLNGVQIIGVRYACSLIAPGHASNEALQNVAAVPLGFAAHFAYIVYVSDHRAVDMKADYAAHAGARADNGAGIVQVFHRVAALIAEYAAGIGIDRLGSAEDEAGIVAGRNCHCGARVVVRAHAPGITAARDDHAGVEAFCDRGMTNGSYAGHMRRDTGRVGCGGGDGRGVGAV